MRKKLTASARRLRRNLTHAEKYLWGALRHQNLGVKFRRQAMIGTYIVDFVCFERKLVVEVDGGQHGESLQDKVRDQWLIGRGFHILRFWNHEVLRNRDGVLQKIVQYFNNAPLPALPAEGEGKRCG